MARLSTGPEKTSLRPPDDRKRKGLLHQLSDLQLTYRGRNETHSRKRVPNRAGEKIMRRADYLERRDIDASARVNHKRDQRIAFYTGLTKNIRINRSGRVWRRRRGMLHLEVEEGRGLIDLHHSSGCRPG